MDIGGGVIISCRFYKVAHVAQKGHDDARIFGVLTRMIYITGWISLYIYGTTP